jgi:hypothetical protein
MTHLHVNLTLTPAREIVYLNQWCGLPVGMQTATGAPRLGNHVLAAACPNIGRPSGPIAAGNAAKYGIARTIQSKRNAR